MMHEFEGCRTFSNLLSRIFRTYVFMNFVHKVSRFSLSDDTARIEDAITNASFVAVDLEFSGYDPSHVKIPYVLAVD